MGLTVVLKVEEVFLNMVAVLMEDFRELSRELVN